MVNVSVSLQSIIHSYWNDDYFYIDAYGNLFPSPYGVIFILTVEWSTIMDPLHKFPSPYGVSFILTY